MKNKIQWTTVDVNDEATWPDGGYLVSEPEEHPDWIRVDRANKMMRLENETILFVRWTNTGCLFRHGSKWAVIE